MLENREKKLSVAPMMDWTDRHCRYLHRLMTKHTLLYTEMVTAPALVRGGARHLLAFDTAEHPVAVQLGGSDPRELAEAARIAADEGFDEINLNIGCPSDRVQSGCFGAVLMENPDLVAECVTDMIAAQPVEVTVKCRIGVDDQDPGQALPEFITKMREVGVRRMAVHARKAWLKGLSPKENREIPPLNYPLVYAMKAAFPDMHLSVNGGVDSLDEAEAHIAKGMDGVMIGRAAYHNPAAVLLDADRRFFDATATPPDRFQIVDAMRPYIANHLQSGGRLHQITRHMLGLFTGLPGARHWRRVLSEQGTGPDAGFDVIDRALSVLRAPQELRAS